MAVSRATIGYELGVWLPPVLVAAVIFVLSATPDLTVAQTAWIDLVVRKLGHIAVFGLLSFTTYRAIDLTIPMQHSLRWALGATLVYALSDEYHQLFVVGRHGSLLDFGVDTIGILLGIIVWHVVSGKTKAAPRRRRRVA